ncbi:MAG: DUF1611 domain-containing protein [Fimbriimonadaceae bacterium]|nr:MAG: DUF1611 domain-containing protein [Fimbriimonadaceae bacterium]
MIQPQHRLALYMAGAFEEDTGKMGLGVLRYSRNEVVAVVDPAHAGDDLRHLSGVDRDAPIVATVGEAAALGADVLVLGIAPSGGRIPQAWWPVMDDAVALGLSLVNGLHDRLGPRYPNLASGQFVWDVRVEPSGLGVSQGRTRLLKNRRVLFVGSDMSVGKMTAGLETLKAARDRGIPTGFVATGQIGIVITGAGIPLDAVRVDYAAGAIEAETLKHEGCEIVLVEGQGAFIHPSSTSPLPLLRGSQPTHLVLCHRAGMKTLGKLPWVEIPPLRALAELNETVAEAAGVFQRPRTVAVALNTAHMSAAEAERAVQEAKEATCLPACDPVRHGAEVLLDAILA